MRFHFGIALFISFNSSSCTLLFSKTDIAETSTSAIAKPQEAKI